MYYKINKHSFEKKSQKIVFFLTIDRHVPLRGYKAERSGRSGKCARQALARLLLSKTLKHFFSVFYFYNFLNVACKIKKKLNQIATSFQRHYLQFCFLLSVNQKGFSEKMCKRVWQVVETIFFASKITFFC